MNLQYLIANIQEKQVIGNTDIQITQITTHSKNVRKGALFICIKGFNADGHDYIDEAVKNGAKAILISEDVNILPSITYIKVSDCRQVAPIIADTFYDSPSSKLKLIGITGTNGKTTTAYFIESILNSASYIPARISTISYKIGNYEKTSIQTTPEAIELQQILANAVECGTTHVVMEVSSHALSLHRVTCCRFDAGIFTNFTLDHLDFHKTKENYLAAKMRLFKGLDKSATAIINIDDSQAKNIISNTAAKIITYGLSNAAEVYAYDIQSTKTNTAFFLNTITDRYI
jgi:UDP-N-acetylmuramoyl-L-alanyl-D-glutamate--2,6-diaminopimelate ligase